MTDATMRWLLSLADDDALKVPVVGAKAARLAVARRRGLPVLPGYVVPAGASQEALAAGKVAIQGRGLGAARAAVTGMELPQGLRSELAVTSALGETLIVRSSTRLDDDGAWAGAFASLLDIAPSEVTVAVSGCWASLFAPAVIARLAGDSSVDDVGLAVLIQRQINPEAGGWARTSNGSVEIAMVAGSPAPLLEGWEPGRRVTVARDGSCIGRKSDDPVDARVLATIADMARRAERDVDGANRMEWAIAGGSIVVLQLARVAQARRPTLPQRSARYAEPAYARLAGAVVARRGRLVDHFLVPWAICVERLLPTPLGVHKRPADLFEQADRLAVDLGRQVQAAVHANINEIADRLARGDADLAARLARVTVDPVAAARLLGALDAIGTALTTAGRLSAPEELWRQSPDWIRLALRGQDVTPPVRWVADRWSEMLFGVTAARGEWHSGVAASGGRAAGRAAFIGSGDDAAAFQSGDVLVATRPIPSLSPLLWQASGLVTAGGSPAAHLCEVSRALGVPAVVSVAVSSPAGDGILAIDGDTGDVWQWRPAGGW